MVLFSSLLWGSVVIFGSSVSLPCSYTIWWAPGTLCGSSTHQYVLVHAVGWSHSSSSSQISFLSLTPTCTRAHSSSGARTCCLLCVCPLTSSTAPSPPCGLTLPLLSPSTSCSWLVWVLRPSWGLCLGSQQWEGAGGKDRSWQGLLSAGKGLGGTRGLRICCLWSTMLPFHQLKPKALMLDSHNRSFNLRHHASYSVLPYWFWNFSRHAERRWYLCFPWLDAPCDDWGVCLIFEFLLTLPAIAASLLWHLSEAAVALSDCFIFSSVQYFPPFFLIKETFHLKKIIFWGANAVGWSWGAGFQEQSWWTTGANHEGKWISSPLGWISGSSESSQATSSRKVALVHVYRGREFMVISDLTVHNSGNLAVKPMWGQG